MKKSDETPHLILWDGDCGFCRRSVAWLLRRDRRRKFRATPYQAAPSPPMTPQLFAACEKSVHVIASDGRIFKGARAVFFILEHIGWKRAARLLSSPLLLPLCEIGYRIVANNRTFFSRLLFRD